MAEFSSHSKLRDPSTQKRRNARVVTSLEAIFYMDGESKSHDATVIDLGTGGIGISAKVPLYPGDRIFLQFSVNEESISTFCVVSRASGKNFGLIFENPEDPVVETVQDYIQKKFFAR